MRDVVRIFPAPIDGSAAMWNRDRTIFTVLTGAHAGQVLSIDAHEMMLGRGKDCELRVDDPGVGRRHARIHRGLDGRVFYEDQGTVNGTRISGTPITRVELQAGDRIQVGTNVVLRFAVIDAIEEGLARQLYESATRDALTRVYNRRYFDERLLSEVAYAKRHGTRLSSILLDIDHFKNVNDTHGHMAGDHVLRIIAGQVGRTLRAEDVVARYGGEEFGILVRGIEHSRVAQCGERVRRAVEKLNMPWQGQLLRATVSLGVASLDECGESTAPKDLIALADGRLYTAKNEGRNRVQAA